MSIAFANIINPRSVAIIGASEDMHKFGGRIMGYLHRHRYGGTIYPINPKYDAVLGITCYPNVLETPQPPDIVIMAIPAAAVVKVVAQCVQRGAGCAIIITTGFAEMNAEGRRQQAEILELARSGDMRIWGPNCMGMVNPVDGVALSSTYTQDVPELIPGSIGMVSQSGGLFAALFNRANDERIGLRAVCSTGNEADIDTSEILEYYLEDDKTTVMAVYCEGLRHPRRFRRVARQALMAGKPIVIYKVGSSAQGAQAALSHTASLAGSDQSFNDLCRQYGIIRVHTLESLLPTANLFARYGLAAGERLGVITGSGGHAGIIPDRAEHFGLELSELSTSTREFLHGVIGSSQSVNPADFAVLGMDGLYQQCVEAIGSDARVDALLYAYATTPEWDKRMNYLIDYAGKVSKPVFFYTLVGSAAGDTPAKARAAGIPYFNDLDACLQAIRDWQWYARIRRKRVAQREISATPAAEGPASHQEVDLPRETCPGEIAVKSILDRLDIRTPARRLACSAAEAVEAAEELGYPVVLKVAAPQLAHKSDLGGVHLGLDDAARVKAAFESILDSVRTAVPRTHVDGVLVERMVPAGLELILGARQDPLFGSQILLGAGGIYTELLDRKSTRFTPLDEADVGEMLSEARVDGLLAGIRTGKPLDREALVLTVLRLATFMERQGDRVQEMDINPLVVMPAGKGVYALDGFMRLSDPAAR